jgi:hypothetical protein
MGYYSSEDYTGSNFDRILPQNLFQNDEAHIELQGVGGDSCPVERLAERWQWSGGRSLQCMVSQGEYEKGGYWKRRRDDVPW